MNFKNSLWDNTTGWNLKRKQTIPMLLSMWNSHLMRKGVHITYKMNQEKKMRWGSFKQKAIVKGKDPNQGDNIPYLEDA